VILKTVVWGSLSLFECLEHVCLNCCWLQACLLLLLLAAAAEAAAAALTVLMEPVIAAA